MTRNVLKKSLVVLVSGAALFLTLGAGCENDGDGDGDRPGVEQQDEQQNEQDDQNEQDGDQEDGN
ncbi:hypothetical protein ACIQMJ_10370 [Actinosynnema sp. NPDC091369]